MKSNIDGWHTCDWCEYTHEDKNFRYLGILDLCQKCSDKHPLLGERVRVALNEAQFALDYVHGQTDSPHLCHRCGDIVAEVLCHTCMPGYAWRPFPSTEPPQEHRVLVITAANNYHTARWDGHVWHTRGTTLHEDLEVVTHWQPIPPRPEDAGPFVVTYSGFTTGSPVNIAARAGPVFQIHAEDGKEVQRLVTWLNERYGEDDD